MFELLYGADELVYITALPINLLPNVLGRTRVLEATAFLDFYYPGWLDTSEYATPDISDYAAA